MRPQRLIMEGFLAYRQRTEIDFSDADLFVLSGPTGAGKSSVIDGMTFALFGTIPRLDDRRSVAPVISALADQARVSFEFSINGDLYTAVRSVRRTKSGGATTPEARLQRGEEVVASGADEVTAAVSDLLGLGFDHFTKAVVLPQGAFADFLTDRPGDRQALLRALLELGLFERVKTLANERAAVARGRAENIETSLAKLEVPSEDQIAQASHGMKSLEKAEESLATRLSELAALEHAAAIASAMVDELGRKTSALEEISIPDGLERLADDREAVAGAIAATKAEKETSADDLAAIAAQMGEHQPAQLEAWLAARRRVAEWIQQRDGFDLPAREAVFESAIKARDLAREAVDQSRAVHAAHELRLGLEPGLPCPVCDQVVSGIPSVEASSAEDLGLLTAVLADADREAELARDRLKETQGEERHLTDRITELETELAKAPDMAHLEIAVARSKELAARHDQLVSVMEDIDRRLEELSERAGALEVLASGLSRSLIEARDAVASDQPPAPGEDPVASWLGFAHWRASLLSERVAAVKMASDEAGKAASAVGEKTHEIEVWLEDLGVESTGSHETDLALALDRKRSELANMERTIAQAAGLTAEHESEASRAVVAASLGNHLRTNNFEAWLMEEALDVLIEGANRLLDDLSGAAYSLRSRNSQFEVIDHRNADQIRVARSLSGGETFLVALSLALSMSEQLAQLTGTASRLESVFLDEGFGSLDQESLELVAQVLDELSGKGRMVGLVTHVRELADRIPVRFEVTKGPDTARIQKVVL
jgi:DNA repair protein SbcC/Rad50